MKSAASTSPSFIASVSLAVSLVFPLPAVSQPPPSYRSLDSILSRYGLPTPASNGRHLGIATPQASLRLEADSRRLICNGMVIWMNEPAQIQSNAWTIAESDAAPLLDLLFGAPETEYRPTNCVIILDPGHGGLDNGAMRGTNTLEKSIVLDIAFRAQRELLARGFDVIMTRTNDTFVPLTERTHFAREHNANVFVSVHLNWAENANAFGVETFLLNGSPSPTNGNGNAEPLEKSSADLLLACDVHRNVLAATRSPDRGVRRARFEVLRSAPCPAVLVECGFLSHAKEAARFADQDYLQAVASAIARGIIFYLSRLTRP